MISQYAGKPASSITSDVVLARVLLEHLDSHDPHGVERARDIGAFEARVGLRNAEVDAIEGAAARAFHHELGALIMRYRPDLVAAPPDTRTINGATGLDFKDGDVITRETLLLIEGALRGRWAYGVEHAADASRARLEGDREGYARGMRESEALFDAAEALCLAKDWDMRAPSEGTPARALRDEVEAWRERHLGKAPGGNSVGEPKGLADSRASSGHGGTPPQSHDEPGRKAGAIYVVGCSTCAGRGAGCTACGGAGTVIVSPRAPIGGELRTARMVEEAGLNRALVHASALVSALEARDLGAARILAEKARGLIGVALGELDGYGGPDEVDAERGSSPNVPKNGPRCTACGGSGAAREVFDVACETCNGTGLAP